VIDTGIGIKEEDQSKLFRLFGFVQDEQQLNTSGIGLGLMISKKIAEQFGGGIELKSKFGEGSTFTFRVNLEEPDHVGMQGQGEEENQEVRVNHPKLVFEWQPEQNDNGEVKYKY